MASRFFSGEALSLLRVRGRQSSSSDQIPTQLGPPETPEIRIPTGASESIPEDQPTNPQRIKCLEELHTVEPDSAKRLEAAFEHLPHLGELFHGFRLVEKLGEGAFGVVYRAEQVAMANRMVALKISADLFGETQSLSQLQHTNIMPIYSAHSFPHLQAICMPFYGRATLADWCRELRTCSVLPTSAKMIVSTLQNRLSTVKSVPSGKEARSAESMASSNSLSNGSAKTAFSTPAVLRQIEAMNYVDAILWLGSRLADALAHAHERGILHRDLKPANVLLTDDGVPMILDFNLSEDMKTREAELMVRVGGTLPFMSPEQLEIFQGGARGLDGRTDIYALGLILYQLLTGQHPFRVPKGTPAEIIAKLLSDRRQPLPSLEHFNPSISPAVQSIIHKCLAANPADRYANAIELRDDLDRHRLNLPLKYAPNVSVAERFGKWVRRHPWVKSPVTLGLVGTIGVLSGVTTWVANRDHLKQEQVQEFTVKSTQVLNGVTEQIARGKTMLLDWAASPEKLREGSRLLGQALDQYDVAANPQWFEKPEIRVLPEEDQRKLKEQLEESRKLIERTKQLLDPNRKDLQDLIARQTPAQIQAILDGSKLTPVKEENIPELAESDRNALIREFMAAGRYREAIPYLKQAGAKKADDADAWFQLGCCFQMVGEFREGIRAFTVAIAVKPTWSDALWHRSQLHEQANDFRSALADLESILKTEPTHYEALMQSSYLLSRLNRGKDALVRLEPIMNDPQVPTRIWFIRADIRQSMGDLPGAEADRKVGFELEPNEVQSWNARGYLRIKSAPDKAIADFQQAEKLDPRSIHALQNQAHVYGEIQKKPEAALAALDRLLQHHPQYLPAVANRAIYLARLGQVENAVNQVKTALVLMENPYTHFRAACVYALVSVHQPAFKKDALSHLAQSVMHGYGHDLLTSPDLDGVRREPFFIQLHSVAALMRSMKK